MTAIIISHVLVIIFFTRIAFAATNQGRIWSSGFELNSLASGVEIELTGGTGAKTIATSTVHSGSYALRTNSVSSLASWVRYRFAEANSFGPFYFRLYVRIADYPDSTQNIIVLDSTGGTDHVGIRMTPAGNLQLMDLDGTVAQIGSNSPVLNLDTWYRVELKYDATAGFSSVSLDARIDGASFASSNTVVNSAGIGRITFGMAVAAATYDLFWDDIAINTNTFAGDGNMIYLKPNAIGDNSGWTIGAGAGFNFQQVKEVTPDDATTYLKEITPTGTVTDDYNIEDASALIPSDTTISLVQVGVRGGGTGIAARTFVTRIKASSGGTVEESSSIDWSFTGWGTNQEGPNTNNYKLTLYDEPGASTADWTRIALDSVQVGVRHDSASINEVRLSTEWLLVEYGDNTPPSAITNLAASNPGSSSADLAWTASGDDDGIGTAASYDMRYATSTITETNWNSAAQAVGEPTPSIVGTPQTMTVLGLVASTTYYFGIKTLDEVSNTSALSNIISTSTFSAGGPWQGDAFVSTGNGLLGIRNFSFRVINEQTPAQDRATWELNAGDSITLYYKTWTLGVLPPSVPTTVRLRVYSDNGGTIVREFVDGAPPADGSSYTFFATNDGTAGGTPITGTFRLYIEAICSGVCLPGTYDVTSDTNGDKGGLRSGISVFDITKNAYPAGTRYAYGPAGDEIMTFIASSSERFEDTGANQTVRLTTRRNGGPVVENGASQELGVSGSTTASFIADNTYNPTISISYDVEFQILGNANLWSKPWTHIATGGNGANIIRDSPTAARYANRFTVDPRIYFSSDGAAANNNVITDFSIYNRGDTVNWQFYLLNSRNEALSRAVTVSIIAVGTTTENGPMIRTSSSTLYSGNYIIDTAHAATSDTTGSPKKFLVTNTDQTKDSNNAYSVSSLYFMDMHPQVSPTLNQDDFPTEDTNETFTGIISADVFSFFAHVKNVRKDTHIDTSGSTVTFTLKKPDTTIRTTQTSDTGTDGWTLNYDFSTEAPTGSWTITASTTFNGNSGTDTETLTLISPYAGKYAIAAVGWNQTYDIGTTTRFTIQTLRRDSNGIFQPTTPDAAPTYRIRYWDGLVWQELASTSATTALSATATYEATYEVASDSAWYGRKVLCIFSTKMSGVEISSAYEITIASPPINWTGAWNSASTYIKNDAVHYGGSSWRAKQTNSNITPIEGNDWTLLAQKGDMGATGVTGTTGAAGVTGLTGAAGSAGNNGKYLIDAVGWNQTYSIGNTARFTIRTMQKNASSTFVAAIADATPEYALRYWDGATWQELASGAMTILSAANTYESTYAIPNDSSWIGRKIVAAFTGSINGVDIASAKEIEIVGSPAQVVIQAITDTMIPTISAAVRITNEGTAAFEYTYQWCIVAVDTNQCGGGDDVAYGSAAKLIQAGQNFDTTLTLDLTKTGDYIFKVAVWWSNQSSKASRTFTAEKETVISPSSGERATGGTSGGSASGGGYSSIILPQPAERPGLVPLPSQTELQNMVSNALQLTADTISRLLGLQTKVGNLEARVSSMERQLSQRISAPTARPEIIASNMSKVKASREKIYKIRMQ
ncbi:MAG: hypothetical protein Q8R40_03795 [bacterium]|nr:hypothetical protein [bacterium]